MSQFPPMTSALDEEIARAEVYGLLARLWYAAPDAELLGAFGVAPTEAPAAGAFLEEPWRQLVGAARGTDAAAVHAEYDALFGGMGKPEIYLFGSHYLSGFLNDKPPALLRTDLARLGLARGDAVSESEDHVACLFEVMRYLIAGDDAAVANLAQQQAFSPPICSRGCRRSATQWPNIRRRISMRRWPASPGPSPRSRSRASTCSVNLFQRKSLIVGNKGLD